MQISGFPTTTRAGLISTAASGAQFVATLTGTPVAGPGLGGNLVQNGDASNNGGNGTTVCPGWVLQNHSANYQTLVDTNPADAPPGFSTCFKKISNVGFGDDGLGLAFPCLPNTTYTFGFWMKTDGTNQAYAGYETLKADGVTHLNWYETLPAAPSTWTYYALTRTTEGDACYMRWKWDNAAPTSGNLNAWFGGATVVQGTYTAAQMQAMFSSNPLGNKSLVACEATTNLLADGDCEGVGGTATAVLFSDSFANANAWSVVGGSAPTVAANVLTIPASGKIAAGHPDWWDTQAGGGTSSSQFRFQPQAGFTTLNFETVYQDESHQVWAALDGTNLSLHQGDNGTVTQLGANVACALTAGTNYWFTWSRTGNSLTAAVHADGPTPGAVIATITQTLTISTFSYGKLAIQSIGAALLLGQMGATAYAGVCQVSGPIPSSATPLISAGIPAFCWSKAQSFSGTHSLSIFHNSADGLANSHWLVPSTVTAGTGTGSCRVKTVNFGSGRTVLVVGSTTGPDITGTFDWKSAAVTGPTVGGDAFSLYLQTTDTVYFDCLGVEQKGYNTLNLDPFAAFYVPTGSRAAAYASIPTPSAVTSAGQWTVAVTVRPKVPQASVPTQFIWAESSGYTGINLNASDGLRGAWGTSGQAFQSYTPGTTYRAVLVYNNGTGSFYVNGSLIGTSTSVQDVVGPTIYIGNFNGSDNADADISGIVLANHAWSAAEVAADYANGNPPGLISGGGLYLQPGMLYAQAPDASANSLALPAPVAGRTSSDEVRAGVARLGSVQPLPGQSTVGIQGMTVDANGYIQSGGELLLPAVSITTTQVGIPHSLGRVPTRVKVTPKSNAVIWESAPADAAKVYFTASVAATADIYLS